MPLRTLGFAEEKRGLILHPFALLMRCGAKGRVHEPR